MRSLLLLSTLFPLHAASLHLAFSLAGQRNESVCETERDRAEKEREQAE